MARAKKTKQFRPEGPSGKSKYQQKLADQGRRGSVMPSIGDGEHKNRLKRWGIDPKMVAKRSKI